MVRKPADEADLVPEHGHDFGHQHKPRTARKLVMLLAVAGGIFYLVRRNQRKGKIDEGVWHEAPSP